MSSINDSDIINFLSSCVEQINTDIERRTGKNGELKLSSTQMRKALEEFKSLDYFSNLKIEDVKFDENEKKLLSIGYYLVGAIVMGTKRTKTSINNVEVDAWLDLEQTSPIYTSLYPAKRNNFFENVSKLNNQTNFKLMTLENIISVSKSIPDDYSTSLSQLLYKINNYKIFSNLQKTIPDELIDSFLDAYDDLFTCFEKFLKIFHYTFMKLTGDTTTNFISIQSQYAFQLKERLMKFGRFKDNMDVLLDFTTIEWNAIKHGDVIRIPRQNILEFRAKVNNEIVAQRLTHEEFIQKARTLSSIVFIISRFTRIVFQLKLDQAKSQNSINSNTA